MKFLEILPAFLFILAIIFDISYASTQNIAFRYAYKICVWGAGILMWWNMFSHFRKSKKSEDSNAEPNEEIEGGPSESA